MINYKYLLVIFFLSIFQLIYAEDIQYILNKDCAIYDHYMGSSSSKMGDVPKGEVYKYIGNFDYDYPNHIFRIYVYYQDPKESIFHMKCWIDSENLDLIGSEKLPVSITGKLWTVSYFLDILKTQKREGIYTYEPYWRDSFKKVDTPMDPDWWEDYDSTEIRIRNNLIDIYGNPESAGIGLIIKKITSHGSSYTIDCSARDDRTKETKFGFELQLAAKKDYTLILKPDGDYLDVYLNTETEKLCELVAVNDYVFSAIRDVAKNNPIDLSKIKWPQRASKSTTTSTPATTSYNYRTTVNLRVRSTSDLSSQVITTLPEGTRVKILETGRADTINDIKGNWVKVESETGTTGWCFNGYLSH